jgi:hypothetical protein
LHFNRAFHGGQGADELGVRAIACCLDKSPFVAGEAGLDQFSLKPLELGVGGFFVAFHERRNHWWHARQDTRQRCAR